MKPDDFIKKIEIVIQKYELSDVKTNGYEYYKCSSADGVGAYNKDKYLKLRTDFNTLKEKNTDYYIMLYVLIAYAFNNQIRFNRNGEFNLPPGKRDFNQRMYDKLNSFITLLHKQEARFTHDDFRNINIDELTDKDFVYIDPPYLITCAAYNEQGGWSNQDEEELLCLLDEFTHRGIKFALSNVLEAKGTVNLILQNWIKNRPQCRMIDLNYSYNNSNYQRKNKEQNTREILVINY